ncbi:MAG TPA: glycine zipper 2TM domain-containing protein [Sphingobium sp.]
MRTILLGLAAATLAIPASLTLPIASAQARPDRDYRDGDYRGRDGRGYRDDNYRSEWRGRDGRTYCKKSNGTTGLIIGGVGGALAGRAIDTRGERTTGTLLGAAAGALLGKSIDSKRSCR